jgi:hypothetical protein
VRHINALETYITKSINSIDKTDIAALYLKHTNITNIINNLRNITRAWIVANIDAAYKDGYKDAVKKLKSYGLNTNNRQVNNSNNYNLNITTKLLHALDSIQDRVDTFFDLVIKAFRDLNLQNMSPKSLAGRLIKVSSGIRKIQDWSITPSYTRGVIGAVLATPARADVQATVKDLFTTTFGDLAFIEVSLKNGGTRNYKPSTYYKMVARSEMRFVQTEAVKAACDQYSCDLVKIPRHDNPCEVCEQYQGKIYSLSGLSKKYPKLDIEIPIHPNCEDGIDPYVDQDDIRRRAADIRARG